MIAAVTTMLALTADMQVATMKKTWQCRACEHSFGSTECGRELLFSCFSKLGVRRNVMLRQKRFAFPMLIKRISRAFFFFFFGQIMEA